MSYPRNIFIIILHYGKPDKTRKLHNQLKQSDPSLQENILVVDNHAPQKYSSAWIRLSNNLYWAGALEWTMKKVRNTDCTHVWFLNNDIMFDSKPPIIDRAVQRLAWIEKKIGRVGIYSPSALINPYHHQMVTNRRFQYRTVQYIDGIAPLINIECWSNLKNLNIDENIIGYGVDCYFSLKVREMGWNVVVDHQVAVKHDYHSTGRTIEGFLEQAAHMEHVYLRKMIGPQYSKILRAKSREYKDY